MSNLLQIQLNLIISGTRPGADDCDVFFREPDKLGAMADAIDNAPCVVFVFGRAYEDSPNCRLEASYAHGGAKDVLNSRCVFV